MLCLAAQYTKVHDDREIINMFNIILMNLCLTFYLARVRLISGYIDHIPLITTNFEQSFQNSLMMIE